MLTFFLALRVFAGNLAARFPLTPAHTACVKLVAGPTLAVAAKSLLGREREKKKGLKTLNVDGRVLIPFVYNPTNMFTKVNW